MEQPVWIWVGTVSILIAFGIIGTLVQQANDLQREQEREGALEKLERQCDYVCGGYNETRLSVQVALPPDTVMTTRRSMICLEHDDLTCKRCECDVAEGLVLNYSGPVAEERGTAQFRCTFTKDGPVRVACQG